MCGISGIVAFSSNIIDTNDISEGKAMTSILKHRGPDSIGEFYDKKCYLGNTRLKIIDLSNNASLPMSNKNKTIYMSYNGEVTNFKELKKNFKLEEKYNFFSKSDTEVVLHLYEELGIDFLKHLSGMFAFAIYDMKVNKVFLARDQFGTRPVFYMNKNSKIYFSSEIKSFIDLKCFDPKINYEAIYHYFTLVYIPGTLTPFADISELDGGHYLEIDLLKKNTKVIKYFSPDYKTNYKMTLEEAKNGFYNVMLDSMERNLISDVPLGLTLSGGIDTSCMLAMTKILGNSSNLHTFSLKINESSFDESSYQKIMVDYAKPIHHEISVSPDDVIDNFITQMAYLDEPSGNGAVIPSMLLAKEAKKYVSVLLSGEGGDEITNAYDTHLAYKIRKIYRKFTFPQLRKLIYYIAHKLPASYEKLPFDFLVKRFTEGAELDVPCSHIHWRNVFNNSEKNTLLNKKFFNCQTTQTLFSTTFYGLDFDDDLNKISFLDLKYYFINDLMVKNDRTFMANSVEARFPFADRKVFDFASQIPPKFRIRGLTPRYVQKQAIKKIIPKQIYKRKTMGLELPHSLWFFNGLEKIAKKYLSPTYLNRVEIFNHDYIQKLWLEHTNRRKDNGRALWSILNYIIWHDLFVYKKDFKKYINHTQ